MSSSPPSPVFPAPAAGSNAPFSARLVSNEMGSIRLGGSGRPVPIARQVLHTGNASSNKVAELALASSSAFPAAPIGRRLDPSTRISLDSTASDSSERFRVRRIMPRRSSVSLGTAASIDIEPRPQPVPASNPLVDPVGSSDRRSERSAQSGIERTSTRTRVTNHVIPVNKPSTGEDGRTGQSVRTNDIGNLRAAITPSSDVSMVRKRTRPQQKAVSSTEGGERKQPPVQITSAHVDLLSALRVENALPGHDEAQTGTHASPTRDYSKLPPGLLKHYTHHTKHDTAQRPAVSFVSRVDAATGAQSPIAPWRLLDDRIDHIYEDPSIDMVQLKLFHPFAANDKERKLAERKRLLRAASELRQRELEQKQQNDVLKERKDHIQQMSEAIRSRNRHVATTNRTQSPSPASREASAITARRREDIVAKRKPPVPRLSGTSKQNKRRPLRRNTVSEVPASRPLSNPEASKMPSGSESGDDTLQPSVTGSILLGEHAFGGMPYPDVTRSVLLHTDEEISERETRNHAARSGRGKAHVRKKNKQRRETDTVAPRPETLQRRALAREFMLLQKQTRQFEREKLKQQNEMEQEKRRRQMEELERRRLHNLRQTTRQKKRQLKKESNMPSQAPSNDDMPARQLQSDVQFPPANDDLQSDPMNISDTENDRGRANITESALSPSKSMASSSSDIDGSPERAKEEDPAIVDARLRKLLDLEEKAKSLMAKLHGLTKRKGSVKEPAPIVRRNYSEKQFEIEEPDFESTAQDDEVAESERNDVEDNDALTPAMHQEYEDQTNDGSEQESEDRANDGSEQESEISEQADDSDDDSRSNANFASTQLDIVQAGDYESVNRMSRLSPYEIEARRFDQEIDPELDPRNIGVHRIGVVFLRDQLLDEESNSEKSDEIRRARSNSVASSSDSDSDRSANFPRRSQSSRNRTLEESLEQYMTHLCVREESSHQSRAGSRSSDGYSSSDHTMEKEKPTSSSAYTQQLMVHHSRVDRHDGRLRQLFLQEDDSLSVIHSTALKLLTENREQRRLKLERERIEAEDMEALRQLQKDRQLETVMASILSQVEDDAENDHTNSEQIVIEDSSETGNAPFVTLEQIMEAVERERREEREQDQRKAAESDKYEMHHDKSMPETPKMYWNEMLSTGEPLGRKNPRVAIDTSELILQQHQQEDEATGGIDERPRLLHSPQSLAKRLLAEVELHDAIHDAHLQISLMEHSRAIEQVQHETVMMASAFKEEMENNFSTHQVALQHATLEKKFDSDLQDVMQKLQDIHEIEEQEKQRAASEMERALMQARRQEFGAQTELLAQVDAATYAPLRIDTGIATVVYVDAGVQGDCSDDDTKSKTSPVVASEQSEYEQSVSDAEAAVTATGEDYDDEMFESEAEKPDGSKQSASSVDDFGEDDEEENDEVTDNDSIAYSETQNSRSDMPKDTVDLSNHDEVEEIESQHSNEDADVQSDMGSIVSESENVRSHEDEGVISSQYVEMQDKVQSEWTEGDDEIDSDHASVISKSQIDHHQSHSAQSEHELNDQAGSMSYDDDFEASSPHAKQMPMETVDEPEESDIVDDESATEVKDEIAAEVSEDYSDDCPSSHSSSKNEIANESINLAEANSHKQTVRPTIAVSSLLDRNPVSLRIEESRPRIMVPEPNDASAEAQSYMKDLEVRRQTEESLLQFRLRALEVRLQHELVQLETTADISGTHWANELLLRREALNMNFLAEKANIESLKAANMARYYQDLLTFQALTTYELRGGGAPATFAPPAGFVTSPRVMLVNHPPSSYLAPVTNTSPISVSIQPEKQSGQVSDQYRDDDFASEDGNENAPHYSYDDEQKKAANISVPSIGSELEEDASSKVGEDIVSDHEEEEQLSYDIASEKDEQEESPVETNVITEKDQQEENISDDIKSEHDGDQVEDYLARSEVDEMDVPEEAASEEDDYTEDDYAEDDFALVSTAEDVTEPQTLEEEASTTNENVIASPDVVERSIEDDQAVAEDEDIQMELSHTEADASIAGAELPDETSRADAADVSAEDYGDEMFESEASHSAVKSDRSKHPIAFDDVASSVEMDVGGNLEVQEDEVAEIDSIAHIEAENEISSVHENDGDSLSDHQEVNDIESEHSQGEIESDDVADGNAQASETADIDEDDIASEGVEDAYEEEDFESVSAIDGPVVSSVHVDEESERVYEDEFEGSDLETREAEDTERSTDAKPHEEDDYAAYSDEEFEAGSDIVSAIELLANETEQVNEAAELPLEHQNILELHHSMDNTQIDGMVSPPEGTSLPLLKDKAEDVELSQDLSTVLVNEEKHGELSEVNANSVQAVSLSGSDSEEILTKSIENHLKRLKEIEQQILDRRQEMKQIEKQKKVERRREDLCNKERDLCQEMERVETQLRLEQANLELARHRNRLEAEHLATKQQMLKAKSWQPDLLSAFDYVEVVDVVMPRERLIQVPILDSEPISQTVEQAEPQDVSADAHDVKDVKSASLDLLEEFAHVEDAETVDSDMHKAPPIEDENESTTEDASTIRMNCTDVPIEEEEQSQSIEAEESPVRAQPNLSLSYSGDLRASFDYVEDVEEPTQHPSHDLLAQFDFVEEVELTESYLSYQKQTSDAGVGNSSLDHEINSNYDDSIAESNEMEHLREDVGDGFCFVSESENYAEEDDAHEPDEQLRASISAAAMDESVSRSNHLAIETEIEANAPMNVHEENMRIRQVDRITELIYHELLTTFDEDLRIMLIPNVHAPLEETEIFAVGHQQQQATADINVDEDESQESAVAIVQQPNDTTARDAAYIRITDSLFREMYEEILASGMQGRHQTQAQSKAVSRSTTSVAQAKQPAAIETPTMAKRCMACAHAILEELSLSEDGRIYLPTRAKNSSQDTHATMVYDVVAELLADCFEPQVNARSLEECRAYILRELETLLMVQRCGQDDLEHQIRRVFSAEGETHGDDCAEGDAEEAHIKAQIRSSVSFASSTMEHRLLLPTALRSASTKSSELRRPRKTAAMTTAITQELDSLQDQISDSIFDNLLAQL